jgi:hypothetical protein
MIAYFQAHKEDLLAAWSVLATILFLVSERLGWSEKYKSSSVFEFFYNLVKKAKLEKKPE